MKKIIALGLVFALSACCQPVIESHPVLFQPAATLMEPPMKNETISLPSTVQATKK